MNITRGFVALVLALCFGTSAIPSEEGVLAWGNFRVESPGIGESGPVVVSGEQTASGLRSLKVEAFEKTVLIANDHLKKLKDIKINAMQLSYEAGYRNLGGRRVYLLFSMGFTSGTHRAKILSFNERGNVEVADVQRR